MIKLFKSQRGFTLVEMIVSLAIFSVVAVVALGALAKIISANQKAQSLQSAMTNLNFALEAMSREIRVGTNYQCDSTTSTYSDTSIILKGCSIFSKSSGGTPTIAFKSTRTNTDSSGNLCSLVNVYRFISDTGSTFKLQKAEQTTCGSLVGGSTSDFSDVFSLPNISLTDYALGVGPVTGGVIDPAIAFPRVFIRLTGNAGDREKTKTYFDIQTTISQRVPI